MKKIFEIHRASTGCGWGIDESGELELLFCPDEVVKFLPGTAELKGSAILEFRDRPWKLKEHVKLDNFCPELEGCSYVNVNDRNTEIYTQFAHLLQENFGEDFEVLYARIREPNPK